MKKIVLFTANVQGGILQFVLQLYKTLKQERCNVKVFMPFEIKNIEIGIIKTGDLFQYHKEKKIINKTSYRNIASKISKIDPDYIWYCDDSVICSNVGIYLNGSTKQLLTLHDAGTYHPTNHRNIRSVLLDKYKKAINKRFYNKVYRFVLLSSESMKTFGKLFPQYVKKTRVMTLGAHLPDVVEVKPKEMTVNHSYLLFFGRIDKYKGISKLLSAYQNVFENACHLVIAGNGKFSDAEQRLINNCGNLTIINRYLADGEMKWLFHHMSAAVLPYIEATQSGIIPLAYLFGKPVIVSDVSGLTQFVENGKTGVICGSQEELKNALVKIPTGVTKEKIKEYYSKYMDWNTNVRELFIDL